MYWPLKGSVAIIFRPIEHTLLTHKIEIVNWPRLKVHYQEKTTIIKTALKRRHEKDAYHFLDRPGQVTLARLYSGHNRLNAHMHRKLKIVPSSTCTCGEEDQTTMFFREVTDTNQSESHSGHQQLRFTRNCMGAWRTWRRLPTWSLLLYWSCRRTRRRRRRN